MAPGWPGSAFSPHDHRGGGDPELLQDAGRHAGHDPAVPLVIYTGAKGDRATVSQFAGALPLGIVGTVAFTAAVWLTARAGWQLGSIIVTGYLAWGVAIGLVLALRRWLGG